MVWPLPTWMTIVNPNIYNMRTAFLFLSGIFLSLSVVAQTLTVQFIGTNKTRNFQVVIDGISYYSNSTATSGGKKVTVSSLEQGNHSLTVYNINNSRYTSGESGAKTTGKAVYTKTFTTRAGYDMHIAIKGTGQVSFTEKRNRNPIAPTTVTPMSATTFNALSAKVKSSWSQSTRISSVRSAFSSTANYFSTDQVGELLTLITSEASRLELAKLVFQRVTDQAMFGTLNELFLSKTYHDNFEAFIKTSMPGTTSGDNPTSSIPVAMSATAFNQVLANVRDQWSQASKTSAVKSSFTTSANYFKTNQVGQLLSQITAEKSRLELAKLVFPKVTDKANYRELTELFTTTSIHKEFETFIENTPGSGNPAPATPVAMSGTAFNQLLANVRDQWSQASKTAAVKTSFSTSSNYFNTNQVGQLLSQITAEAGRLDLAKMVYARVTDKVNYHELTELFTTTSIRSEFETFIGVAPVVNPGSGTNYGNRSPVSDATFTSLLQNVNNQYQQSGKVAVVRDALNNANSYFTTVQLRQLITPITAETERLALLKEAYNRVADVSSFSTLNDLLFNQSSRTELDNHVRTGGNVAGNYSNRVAMADAEYSRLALRARLHFRQTSVIADIRTAFNGTGYYSVTQIQQLLQLVSAEADRLALAKLAFHRVTDPTTYKQLDDLFNTQASKDELARYTAANWF